MITAAHDWTGQLAANGLVEPLFLSAADKKQFPAYTLQRVLVRHGRQEAVRRPRGHREHRPRRQHEAREGPDDLLAARDRGARREEEDAPRPSASPCSRAPAETRTTCTRSSPASAATSSATNNAGNLDPSDIGVANPTFLKNAPLIDKWNKEGLISSKVDSSAAQNAFLKRQTAFWITGPWNSDTLKKSGLQFKVVQMPAIAKPSVPFLGVQGFMVTKFATEHGVDSAAKDLVTNFMATASAQTQLAAANGRPPANIKAASSDPVLAQFSPRRRAACRCRTSRR